MRFPGFIGPTYTLDSVNIDAQRCVNWYLKINEMRTGKSGEIMSLIPTPGLELLGTVGDGPIRGHYRASDNKLYVVSKNELYKVESNWVPEKIGDLLTSSGIVDFADNGTTLVVVDGPNGYYSTLGSNTTTRIDDIAWLGSTRVEYLDGYFIFNKPNSGIWYISEILSTEIDPLDFATAESNPDDIIATQVNHRELWIFGESSIEVWYNSGAADFPFERISSGILEMGCAAAFSVNKIDKTTFWLGKNKDGEGVVYAATGFIPQRISTHAVELQIQSYNDISDAVAWTYQENGHFFYVLNFPDAETSWVYDLSSGMWHERAYFKDGNYERHRANFHSYVYNTHVVGDYENANIYHLNSDFTTDNGDEIRRLRAAPHIDDFMKRVIHNEFQLELETGLAVDGKPLDEEAQIVLQFSDDGGHNWSNEKFKGIGKVGKKRTRVHWHRLGASRDKVYRVILSDPVKTYLIGAELTLKRTMH